MTAARLTAIDSDGLNPYGRSIGAALAQAADGELPLLRRRAPVDTKLGRAYGPVRGGAGSRAVRALRLGASLSAVTARALRSRAVLLMWETAGDALLLLILRLGRRRVVATLHDPRRAGLNHRAARWALARFADTIVMHSQQLADEFARSAGVDPCRLLVLPLPSVAGVTRPAERSAARARLGLPENDRIVLWFGQLRPYKGIETLVAAMETVLAERRRTRLVVAGMVKDPELERLLVELQRSHPDAVTLLVDGAPLAGTLLDDALSAADLVALPFTSASQSGSTVHAMSFGRPVLTTDVGDLSRLARLGVVRAVQPGDPAALAAACIELLDDDDARSALVRRASDYVRTELDPGHIGERLVLALEGR